MVCCTLFLLAGVTAIVFTILLPNYVSHLNHIDAVAYISDLIDKLKTTALENARITDGSSLSTVPELGLDVPGPWSYTIRHSFAKLTDAADPSQSFVYAENRTMLPVGYDEVNNVVAFKTSMTWLQESGPHQSTTTTGLNPTNETFYESYAVSSTGEDMAGNLRLALYKNRSLAAAMASLPSNYLVLNQVKLPREAIEGMDYWLTDFRDNKITNEYFYMMSDSVGPTTLVEFNSANS